MTGLVGLVVNPVAGMGGRVGLHGTDGSARLAEARRRGAVPVSVPRAARALGRLRPADGIEVIAAPAAMGMDAAHGCAVPVRSLGLRLPRGATSAADTRAVAAELAAAGVDLLLFAGGDGTARDVLQVVGDRCPMLGIPTGVKMRSGVFAPSPAAAGELARAFLTGADRKCAAAEIVDADEGAPGSQFPGTTLHGIASVPWLGTGRLPGPKSSGALGTRATLDALCRTVAAELVPGWLYLFGPGTTTAAIMASLGLTGTPLGIDAVIDGELAGADLGEGEILALMAGAARVKLVLGVVGGQGFLLGRGNQQLSPRVLARLAPEDLVIVSSAEKLMRLDPPVLWADTGDEPAVGWISGYHRVRIAPDRYMMMAVAAAA